MKPILRVFQILGVFALVLPLLADAKTLNARLVNPPVSLDWNGLATLSEAPIIVNICEGLYAYDYQTRKLVPAIAASLKKSKDLTEYTFEISKDAKWSDGRPIYAQDFVDAWLRLISPQSGSIYSYYLFGVENAREYNNQEIKAADKVGLKAIGDRTLVVKLKRPTQNWEAVTAFWPLSPIRKDLIEKLGANWSRAGVLVSSGPFVFESYEPGKKVVLKRNPYYKKTASNVDEVNFQILIDHSDTLKKYESKQFLFLNNLPAGDMRAKSSRKDYVPISLLRHYLIAFNAQKFPFNDKNARLAVLSAIDRTKLLPDEPKLFKVADTLIPRPFPGSEKSTSVKFDLKKAKEYQNQSGSFNAKTKVSILTNIYEPYQKVAKSIKNQLAENLKLNVDVSALQSQEYNAYANLADYNMIIMSWTAKVVSSQDFLLPYSGEALSSRTHYVSTFFDQWIFEGMQTSNTKEASKSFYEAQRFLSAEQGIVNPLFFETSGALVNPAVKNLYFDHMGLAIFRDVQIP